MALSLNSKNFDDEVLHSDIPVLVDFWAPWCGPCRMIAPIIDELSEELKGIVKVCKVDVDDEGDLASKFNVMNIPTLAVFKKGNLISIEAGAKDKESIKKMLDL